MKKDDIIGQKLFETCKLSEFYLNLIINSNFDTESPLRLANAYRQKLYEIVERYDRLLDATVQRENLTLAFDRQQQYSSQKPPRIPTSSRANGAQALTPNSTLVSRTSTPNKIYQNPLNISTTTCSSYASTPTTPIQSSTFSRSSSSSNFQLINGNASCSTMTGRSFRNRSYLNLNGKQQNQSRLTSSSSHHSNLKLDQKLASLYYDDYYSCDNDNDHEVDNEAAKLLSKSSSSSSSSSSSASETAYDYDMECQMNEMNELEMTAGNHTQVIEKSYSNLSKDSGVLADSYHSDYSNCILSGVGSCLNTSNSNVNDESGLNNTANKLITVNSNLIDTERTLDNTLPVKDDLDNDNCSSPRDDSQDVDSQSTTYEDEADDRLEDALTTHFDNRHILRHRNLVVKQSIDLNLKKTFKLKAASDSGNEQSQQYKTYTKKLSSKYSKKNLNLDLSELDLIDAAESNELKRISAQSSSDLSSTSSSTPSPSSSCSGSNQTESNINNSSTISASTSDVNSPLLSAKSTGSNPASTNPFFFNYNSLMNVSMLDSIQVTNNNLDLDTMSSSILMFN